ncbi:MAG: Tagatose-6-phosphate kinase [Candidatus Jettenia ecosi]|uniref:Tagatose-6-phosphate kinase n=1 Tax=Candidatus Jettenia ecosi TaxID=2494326 RepID=A0A533Q6V8_9BACT|nr:MAG: Tagatose-6-phosphate kinase [Candidatus Jettenia ecosi]
MQIITLTMNPTIDTSCNVDHVIAEKKLRGKSPRHEPGGGGINVSRTIKKLGGESTALYTSGGPIGQMLQILLNQEHINHQPIEIEGMTRENFIVLEESTQRQFRFGMPGPTLHDREWQQCLDSISRITPSPEYIVASGSLPPGVPDDFYAQVAQRAKKPGSRICIDTSGEALRLAAGAHVYLLKPNMSELQYLAGEKIKNESHVKEVAKKIIERGKSEVVVISLGAAGAFLVSKDGYESIRAPVVPIESKVGAGDSMVAGIVVSLAKGSSLQDAVRFGIAAGSAAVMTPGTELCRREDAEYLYQQMISGIA